MGIKYSHTKVVTNNGSPQQLDPNNPNHTQSTPYQHNDSRDRNAAIGTVRADRIANGISNPHTNLNYNVSHTNHTNPNLQSNNNNAHDAITINNTHSSTPHLLHYHQSLLKCWRPSQQGIYTNIRTGERVKGHLLDIVNAQTELQHYQFRMDNPNKFVCGIRYYHLVHANGESNINKKTLRADIDSGREFQRDRSLNHKQERIKHERLSEFIEDNNAHEQLGQHFAEVSRRLSPKHLGPQSYQFGSQSYASLLPSNHPAELMASSSQYIARTPHNSSSQQCAVYTELLTTCSNWTIPAAKGIVIGFQLLMQQYECFHINQSLIFQNQSGHVKVWINSNVAANWVQHAIVPPLPEHSVVVQLTGLLIRKNIEFLQMSKCQTFQDTLVALKQMQLIGDDQLHDNMSKNAHRNQHNSGDKFKTESQSARSSQILQSNQPRGNEKKNRSQKLNYNSNNSNNNTVSGAFFSQNNISPQSTSKQSPLKPYNNQSTQQIISQNYNRTTKTCDLFTSIETIPEGQIPCSTALKAPKIKGKSESPNLRSRQMSSETYDKVLINSKIDHKSKTDLVNQKTVGYTPINRKQTTKNLNYNSNQQKALIQMDQISQISKRDNTNLKGISMNGPSNSSNDDYGSQERTSCFDNSHNNITHLLNLQSIYASDEEEYRNNQYGGGLILDEEEESDGHADSPNYTGTNNHTDIGQTAGRYRNQIERANQNQKSKIIKSKLIIKTNYIKTVQGQQLNGPILHVSTLIQSQSSHKIKLVNENKRLNLKTTANQTDHGETVSGIQSRGSNQSNKGDKLSHNTVQKLSNHTVDKSSNHTQDISSQNQSPLYMSDNSTDTNNLRIKKNAVGAKDNISELLKPSSCQSRLTDFDQMFIFGGSGGVGKAAQKYNPQVKPTGNYGQQKGKIAEENKRDMMKGVQSHSNSNAGSHYHTNAKQSVQTNSQPFNMNPIGLITTQHHPNPNAALQLSSITLNKQISQTNSHQNTFYSDNGLKYGQRAQNSPIKRPMSSNSNQKEDEQQKLPARTFDSGRRDEQGKFNSYFEERNDKTNHQTNTINNQHLRKQYISPTKLNSNNHPSNLTDPNHTIILNAAVSLTPIFRSPLSSSSQKSANQKKSPLAISQIDPIATTSKNDRRDKAGRQLDRAYHSNNTSQSHKFMEENINNNNNTHQKGGSVNNIGNHNNNIPLPNHHKNTNNLLYAASNDTLLTSMKSPSRYKYQAEEQINYYPNSNNYSSTNRHLKTDTATTANTVTNKSQGLQISSNLTQNNNNINYKYQQFSGQINSNNNGPISNNNNNAPISNNNNGPIHSNNSSFYQKIAHARTTHNDGIMNRNQNPFPKPHYTNNSLNSSPQPPSLPSSHTAYNSPIITVYPKNNNNYYAPGFQNTAQFLSYHSPPQSAHYSSVQSLQSPTPTIQYAHSPSISIMGSPNKMDNHFGGNNNNNNSQTNQTPINPNTTQHMSPRSQYKQAQIKQKIFKKKQQFAELKKQAMLLLD